MSYFCTPCQFGLINAGTDGQHWVSRAVTYTVHLLGYQLIGLALLGGVVPPLSPQTAASLAALCGNASVGIYAGHARTRLRQKYNLPGDTCSDCVLHTFAAPCAIAQESSELLYRS